MCCVMGPFHLILPWLARNVDCRKRHGFLYGETTLINELIRHRKHNVLVEREKLSFILFTCMRHLLLFFNRPTLWDTCTESCYRLWWIGRPKPRDVIRSINWTQWLPGHSNRISLHIVSTCYFSGQCNKSFDLSSAIGAPRSMFSFLRCYLATVHADVVIRFTSFN